MDILYFALLIIPYTLLLFIPFRQKFYYSKGKTIVIILTSIALCIPLSNLLYTQFGNVGPARLFNSLFFVVFSALLIMLVSRTNLFVNLFIIFFIKNYQDIIILVAQTLRTHFTKNGSLSDQYFYMAILLLVSLPSLLLLFQKFLVPTITRTQHQSFWRYLWILPFFYYATYRLALDPNCIGMDTPSKLLSTYLPPFWIINVCFIYSILFKIMSETLESSYLKEQLKSAQFLNEMQKEQYRLMQNSVEETRKNRHDMNQQFIVIQGFLQQGEILPAQKYIQECLVHYSSKVEQFCDNYAANSIIRYYAAMAEHYEIPFSSSIALPEQLPLSEINFCTILGNLLLNAIEACIRQTGGEKYIQLHIEETGAHMLAITLSNTYSGEIRKEGSTFLSSKREGIGIGTASIQSQVEKHHGILDFSHEGGIFKASILLVSNPPKDISQ